MEFALILNYVFSAIGVVCWFMTVLKMFPLAGFPLAVLGIVFPPWTFVWGWINVEKTGGRKWMIAWAVAFVGAVITGIVSAPLVSGGGA